MVVNPTRYFETTVDRLQAAGCVFAKDESRLLIEAARDPAELESMVERRVAGERLEHILGWAEFAGQRIVIDPGVFIPRPRTEFLAEQAASLVKPRDVVVDLCCGSGAVAAVLGAAVEGLELHAVDIDPVEVRCARRNLGDLGEVYEGDLYDPLPADLRGRIEVLVANAPYVPTAEIVLMPPEARTQEPRIALDGGADGLDVVRRVAAGASAWLGDDAHLLVETSQRQVPQAIAIFEQARLVPRVVRSDELDATVVIGSPEPVSFQR
jgi:putative protein-(glutamine-N5) methyltransferase, unknown substrate-specific